MPGSLQSFPQAQVVVNLAVENDAYRAVLILHGLIGFGREVHYRKPSETKPDTTISGNPRTFAIRPSMDHRIAHTKKEININSAGQAKGKPP